MLPLQHHLLATSFARDGHGRRRKNTTRPTPHYPPPPPPHPHPHTGILNSMSSAGGRGHISILFYTTFTHAWIPSCAFLTDNTHSLLSHLPTHCIHLPAVLSFLCIPPHTFTCLIPCPHITLLLLPLFIHLMATCTSHFLTHHASQF